MVLGLDLGLGLGLVVDRTSGDCCSSSSSKIGRHRLLPLLRLPLPPSRMKI